MKTIASAALAVLAVATAAEGAAASWSVDLAHPAPRAGDEIHWRVAFTNDTDAPIRVPADALERARLSADHCPEGAFCKPRAFQSAAAPSRRDTPASSLDWVTLAPGATLARYGTVAEFLPDACDGGCPAGRYWLHVRIPPRPIGRLADDQRAPAAWSETRELALTAYTLPVTRDPGVTMRAQVAVRLPDDRLLVPVEIENGLPFPLWFPRPSVTFAHCQQRIVMGDGRTAHRRQSASAGGQQPYDETEAVQIPAGGQATLALVCEDVPPIASDAARHYVTVEIVPFRRFQPRRSDAPHHHWEGKLVAPEIRAPR